VPEPDRTTDGNQTKLRRTDSRFRRRAAFVW
jgi:hypothetical protein